MADTYPAYVEADNRPRRRRGRRLLGTLIVLLVLLGIPLVVADRAAAGFAERAVADQVQREVAQQHVQSSEADVSIGGFPFLTQVLRERYESVSIVLRDVRGSVEGNAVSLPQLDMNARNVHASIATLRSGKGEVRAETVNGNAVLTYASVAKLIDQPGLELSEQGGKLAVKAPLQVLGQPVTVNGTAKITVAEGKVRIGFDTLTAEGLPAVPAAQAFVTAYAKQISINLPLPELPFQLQVQQVQPRPDGLAVMATAKDVPINALG